MNAQPVEQSTKTFALLNGRKAVLTTLSLMVLCLALLMTALVSPTASASVTDAAGVKAKAMLKATLGTCTQVYVPKNKVWISTCKVTLTVTNSQVNWAAHVFQIKGFKGGSAPWATFSPATGTIKPGQKVTVTIRTNAETAIFRFLGPNNMPTVKFTA